MAPGGGYDAGRRRDGPDGRDGARRGHAAPRQVKRPGRTPFDDPNAPNAGQPSAPGQPGQNPAEQKPPPFLLLRYFDYTVEPGKHYVYRVRLVLANPNYIPPAGAAADAGAQGVSNLKPGYLKDPKLAEKQWLETDWSEPSPVISVPRDTRVLALSVNPGREPTRTRHARQVGAAGLRGLPRLPGRPRPGRQLPRHNVHSQRHRQSPGRRRNGAGGGPGFDPGMGRARRPGVGAGGAAPGGRRPRTQPRGGRGAVPGGQGSQRRPGRAGAVGRRRPGPGPTWGLCPGGWANGGRTDGPHRSHPKFKVNYYSNTIAIDFRGGEKVSRRGTLSTPGEILLWEPDGTLVVRNELDDKAAIDQLKAVEAPPAPPPAAA